jgi:hypothetical protein
MSDHEIIEFMRKEIGDLKSEIAKLHHMLKLESDSTTKHINELYKRGADTHNYSINNISTLYDIVAPIEEKIFPNVSRVRQQLTAIVEKPAQDSGDKPGKQNR